MACPSPPLRRSPAARDLVGYNGHMSASNAREALKMFLTVGIILSVIGGIVMGIAWPGTTTTDGGLFDAPTVEDTGSWTGVVIGSLIASIGSCAIFVWIIGLGVKLGTQAAQTD